jgi:hypothetical protein
MIRSSLKKQLRDLQKSIGGKKYDNPGIRQISFVLGNDEQREKKLTELREKMKDGSLPPEKEHLIIEVIPTKGKAAGITALPETEEAKLEREIKDLEDKRNKLKAERMKGK